MRDFFTESPASNHPSLLPFGQAVGCYNGRYLKSNFLAVSGSVPMFVETISSTAALAGAALGAAAAGPGAYDFVRAAV